MLLETALGGALGGLLRLAPEVMKFFDRKNERKHELELLDKNTAAEKARADSGYREHQLSADSAQMTGGIQALMEAVKAQGQLTGVKWVDAVNQTVRPFLTYGIVAPYAFGKMFVFFALVWSGLWQQGLTPDMVTASVAATYTAADMGVVAAVLNFWFLGRVFDKRNG
jgi:hypothetical protein